MRSIAILNQKGGVGKTTTAVNLAAALARRGRRVLLVDLDPQANATQHLGVELSNGDASLYDVLVRGAPLAGALRTAAERLAIAPAHIDLVGAEIELADRSDREFALRNALGPHYEHFDDIVIDCAPSLGVLTVNALAAVEEVFIPLQPHFFALQGLGKLIETVTLVRRGLNPKLRISGVLLCMYEHGTRLAAEVAGDVRAFCAQANPDDVWHGAHVFQTHVRRNIKLAEAPSFGKSIFDYDPNCHGALDYDAVAAETLAMGRGDATDAEHAGRVDADESDGSPREAEHAVSDAPSALDADQRVVQQASASVSDVAPTAADAPPEATAPATAGGDRDSDAPAAPA